MVRLPTYEPRFPWSLILPVIISVLFLGACVRDKVPDATETVAPTFAFLQESEATSTPAAISAPGDGGGMNSNNPSTLLRP